MDLQEQIKSMMESKDIHVEDVPWLKESDSRRLRWAKYFEGKHALQEDRQLKALGVVGESQYDALRRKTEVLLDNYVREANKAAHSLLQETTTTGDIATFTTWALPLIRKIWPRLFANQIVSTQPMKGPTGRAHTLDFTYCSSGETYASGTSIYDHEDPDYADDPGECVEPNKICLTVTATTLTAVAKKLEAIWSQEASQDLNSQYGLDLESEVVKVLGMEIEREINRVIINGLASAATTNTNWASTQPVTPNAWANATPRQYAESLFDAICDADNQIFTRVYVHGNFILCGATFANRLRKLNSFRQIDTTDGMANVMSGPNVFGTLNEQYTVYHDPFFTADKAIVGHKSDNWMYTGYVYAPYIPLWSTPVIYNKEMCPSRGVMSRYATYAKNGDFYATVTVT